MWIDEAALSSMPDAEPTRGRPRLYSDALIQALLGLKTVFRLPLRALQGFAQSLRDLARHLAGTELHDALSPRTNA